MLRMYFVQHGFNLGDQACEDALLDSPSLRRFVGIDLGRERVPDATTLLEFRRLLEKHSLGEALFAEVGAVLQTHGMKVGTGTIVDATLISAPSSTKNADKARDPEMHQTRKRKQVPRHEAAHRRGQRHGPGAQRRRDRSQRARQAPVAGLAARPGGVRLRRLCLRVSAGLDRIEGTERAGPDEPTGAQRQRDRRTRAHGQPAKSRVRARIEHVFGVVKRLWGFGKVRYRGLAKNATRAFVALGWVNIYLARKRLAA